MKTPSQQFKADIDALEGSLSDMYKHMIRKMFEILEHTPPTPETAEYSIGKFSKSHELYINGIKTPMPLSPGLEIKPTDKIEFKNPLHYASHVLVAGWDGARMAGVWPGAKQPPYRTYDRAADEMKMLQLNKIIANFKTTSKRKTKR